MQRKVFLLLPIPILFLLSAVNASPSSALDATIAPTKIAQGEVALLRIGKKGEAEPRVTWMGKRISLVNDRKNGIWSGLIGADLTTRPGSYKLRIGVDNNDNPYSKTISVFSKDHGIRHLTLPKEMVELDAPTLERVRHESRKVRTLLMGSAEYPLWMGRWVRPVAGEVVSPFGCRTIINDMERSPHSGVDLRAAEGTPVMATNKGVVALVADFFFSGLSVIIDHGGGIHSMYFHLSQVAVQVGESVEKGAILGLSGCTGRATAPHLHFGIRLNGSRVNPLNLIEISRGFEG